MRRFILPTLAMLAAGLLVAAAAAPAAEVNPSTIDNGGVTSAGGTYAVTGSIGQPDAGELSGGSFVLGGGFWDRSHPFVPVELQSFEVVGGVSPVRTSVPAAFACPEEPVRSAVAVTHHSQAASFAAAENPESTDPEKAPTHDPEPTATY